MKYKKTISILVLCIAILSFIVSGIGIFSSEGSGEYEIKSIHGETISLYGKGIYKNDSISAVAQGKAQDIVTIIMGIPLLLLSTYFTQRGSFRGKLLLTGTLGYFLYTYISYVFLWMYNPLFLLYVILMSTSFFAFTLLMMTFDLEKINLYFNNELPVKFVGGFQIFFSIALFMLWMGRIGPAMVNDSIPLGLEHYSTLVIQGLDLGFIVPISFISGILIIKRKAFGYLLSSIIMIKGITLGTAVTAMVIGQVYAGLKLSMLEIIMFPILNLIILYALILILKNIDEKKDVGTV